MSKLLSHVWYWYFTQGTNWLILLMLLQPNSFIFIQPNKWYSNKVLFSTFIMGVIMYCALSTILSHPAHNIRSSLSILDELWLDQLFIVHKFCSPESRREGASDKTKISLYRLVWNGKIDEQTCFWNPAILIHVWKAKDFSLRDSSIMACFTKFPPKFPRKSLGSHGNYLILANQRTPTV